MRETFIKVQYVVCWAGCNLPLKDRLFQFFDEAMEMYNSNLGKLSLRIEEIAVKTQIKIVWPESIRKKDM